MTTFDAYATKYQTIRMQRRHGILQMTLHTDGGPLRWGFLPHAELPQIADGRRRRRNGIGRGDGIFRLRP